MKKWNFYALSLICVLAFANCSEDSKKMETGTDGAVKDDAKENKEALCLFDYDHRTTTLNWEAYKFNEKIGVKGKLANVSMSPAGKGAETMEDLFTGSIFKVMTNSVDSENQERDDKIRNFFFGNLNDGDIFSGTIKSVNGDNSAGVMYFNTTISRVTKDIKFNYTVDETGKFVATGEIDMTQFGGGPAVDSLNEKCDELHKGADGESKLWPNVKITIETTLKKDCQ